MSNTPAMFEPAQKKSHMSLFIVGGIVAFFALVGVVGFAAFMVLNQDDPFANLKSKNINSINVLVPESWQIESTISKDNQVVYAPEEGSSLNVADTDIKNKYKAFVFVVGDNSTQAPPSSVSREFALSLLEAEFISGGQLEKLLKEGSFSEVCDDEPVVSDVKKNDSIEGVGIAFSGKINCSIKTEDTNEKTTINIILAFSEELSRVDAIGLVYQDSIYDKHSEALDEMLGSISVAN